MFHEFYFHNSTLNSGTNGNQGAILYDINAKNTISHNN